MKLIVGLGNPKAPYHETRHNAGRLLVEYLAKKLSQEFQRKKSLKASLAVFEWEGEKVAFAYPENYMNASGESVSELIHFYKLDFKKELLVVVDDVALPFGRCRLRGRGSDGGHNGLKSIQASLGSSDYARLRIGIAPPVDQAFDAVHMVLEEYVLSPFQAKEKELLPSLFERGYDACRIWVGQSLQAAMNIVNPSESAG